MKSVWGTTKIYWKVEDNPERGKQGKIFIKILKNQLGIENNREWFKLQATK